ncbi:MAG: ATP-binding cassette domain-containing protein [Prosthecobacter sp.]|nr:ATP-binding cassette domain-containing protein [Prosthecobacter sp.]
MLRVQNATFIRGGRRILKGIHWEVTRGQHWCVLGPNGCGKTSLINLITGYEPATDGLIQIGSDTFGGSDWREVRRRVGLVTNTLTTYLEPGEPILHVVASGRDAKLNLWQPPSATLKKQAMGLIQAAGCGYLKNSLWGTLSQGEKQKILICRALMAQFDVLILDEPCAGLDPVAREQFLSWMEEISTWPEAPSLVMVTHHVEEILPCITHVLLLRDGAVLAQGKKEKTLTSAALGAVYGAPVRLSRRKGRYALQVLA